ncbi:MAG: lipid II:glycine glycyltransferase FemX [Candidatus Dojkabacteria bacterium]
MNHFLNSIYWKKVKEALGNKVYSADGTWFQTTKLPKVNKYIGYIPRADLNKIDLHEIYKVAKQQHCVYVSIDPDNLKDEIDFHEFVTRHSSLDIRKGRPTQLQATIVMDLTKREEELLSAMKQKHRYNIKIAKKNNVEVKIDNTKESINTFVNLHEETVTRQEYNDRDSNYIKKVWEVLNEIQVLNPEFETHIPETFIATAYFEGKPLGSWFLIGFGDTLYYPYGGSSEEHKNVMANYLLVWEVIKFGQQKGYKKLDLMGVLPDKSDGYSRFKVGFGGEEIEYADTIDIVIDPLMYKVMKSLSFLRGMV